MHHDQINKNENYSIPSTPNQSGAPNRRRSWHGSHQRFIYRGGNPADFEGIHYVILMMGNELELLQLTEDGAIARITIRGILASKIGIITYLSVVIIMKVIAGLAILSAIVSVLIQVFC